MLCLSRYLSHKRCHINFHHLLGTRNWGSAEEIGLIFPSAKRKRRFALWFIFLPLLCPFGSQRACALKGSWLHCHSIWKITEQSLMSPQEDLIVFGKAATSTLHFLKVYTKLFQDTFLNAYNSQRGDDCSRTELCFQATVKYTSPNFVFCLGDNCDGIRGVTNF